VKITQEGRSETRRTDSVQFVVDEERKEVPAQETEVPAPLKRDEAPVLDLGSLIPTEEGEVNTEGESFKACKVEYLVLQKNQLEEADSEWEVLK
jgi:hypothetical protein